MGSSCKTFEFFELRGCLAEEDLQGIKNTVSLDDFDDISYDQAILYSHFMETVSTSKGAWLRCIPVMTKRSSKRLRMSNTAL